METLDTLIVSRQRLFTRIRLRRSKKQIQQHKRPHSERQKEDVYAPVRKVGRLACLVLEKFTVIQLACILDNLDTPTLKEKLKDRETYTMEKICAQSPHNEEWLRPVIQKHPAKAAYLDKIMATLAAPADTIEFKTAHNELQRVILGKDCSLPFPGRQFHPAMYKPAA